MTRSHTRFATVASLVCVLAAASVLSSCNGKVDPAAGKDKKGMTVPVTVGVATTRTVPIEITTFGSAGAFSSVGVKSEVTGTLKKVYFEKGQKVKKGDKLFEIDPRTFAAAVAQGEAAVAQAQGAAAQAQASLALAKANLTRDQAQEVNARKSLERAAKLLKSGSGTQADYDKAQADANAAAATLEADEASIHAVEASIKGADANVRVAQASLDAAKLQLERCSIVSPIDGKVGDILIDEGNIVKAEDLPLVTINQITPIDVFFSIPGADYPTVKKHMAEGKLGVKVFLDDETQETASGELTFVDNSMDQKSGTIRLGATFDNKDEKLWPGQYVDRVVLTLGTKENAVIVPLKAVQTGRDGKYVYVVKDDLSVEMRAVTTGPITGPDVEVLTGLSALERVVVEGQFRLTPDAKVEIKGEGPAKSHGGKTDAAKGSAS